MSASNAMVLLNCLEDSLREGVKDSVFLIDCVRDIEQEIMEEITGKKADIDYPFFGKEVTETKPFSHISENEEVDCPKELQEKGCSEQEESSDSMQEEEVKQESPKTVEEKPKRFLAKDNKEYNEKVLECNSFSALINIIKENKYSIRFIADCLGVPPSSLNQWRTYDSLPRNKDTRTKLSIALFNKFNVPLNKGCQLLGV